MRCAGSCRAALSFGSSMLSRCLRCCPKLARAAAAGGPSRRRAPTIMASRFSSSRPEIKKETLLLGALGAFSGCIGPLVGVGGGIISIPVWREFTALPQKILSATSLVAVGVSACAASVAFVQAGHVDLAAAGAHLSRWLFSLLVDTLSQRSCPSARYTLLSGARSLLQVRVRVSCAELWVVLCWFPFLLLLRRRVGGKQR